MGWIRILIELLLLLSWLHFPDCNARHVHRGSCPAKHVLTFIEKSRIRQLDQHFHTNLLQSDTRSTPYTRVTQLCLGTSEVAKKYRIVNYGRRFKRYVFINNDTVKAKPNKKNAHFLVIESNSFGNIKIRTLAPPIYYLCISDDRKKPVGVRKDEIDHKVVDVRSCLFKEMYTSKQYTEFQSVKYYNGKTNKGCLAFNKHGKPRNITRSRCGHHSTLFMERKSRLYVDLQSERLKRRLLRVLKNTRHKRRARMRRAIASFRAQRCA